MPGEWCEGAGSLGRDAVWQGYGVPGVWRAGADSVCRVSSCNRSGRGVIKRK